jgi:hypothetical protein
VREGFQQVVRYIKELTDVTLKHPSHAFFREPGLLSMV